jgi:peptidylprolyl isomerase
MRKLRCLCVIIFGVMLALTGCTGHSDQSTQSASASAKDPNGVAQQGPFPTVSGGFGDKPGLTYLAGLTPSSALQRKVLKAGGGPITKTGDLLAIDSLGQIWNGKVFDDTYDRHAADGVQIGIGSVLPGWDSGLVGLSVGSRVLLTVPPVDGYGAAGNTTAGIKATDTLVFVIDIAAAYNGHSTADPHAVIQTLPVGIPIVSGSLTVGPTITIPKGLKPPTKKSTYLIAKGNGAPLKSGTAVVQYQGVDWSGALAGSTWQNGTPTAVPVGGAASTTGGLFDSLQGVAIGSRVLVIAPAVAGQPAMTASAAVVVDVVGQITTAKAMAGS